MKTPDGERRVWVDNWFRKPADCMWALRMGDPKASATRSVEQLKRQGVIGWYKCIRISDGAILMNVNGCEVWRTDKDKG